MGVTRRVEYQPVTPKGRARDRGRPHFATLPTGPGAHPAEGEHLQKLVASAFRAQVAAPQPYLGNLEGREGRAAKRRLGGKFHRVLETGQGEMGRECASLYRKSKGLEGVAETLRQTRQNVGGVLYDEPQNPGPASARDGTELRQGDRGPCLLYTSNAADDL